MWPKSISRKTRWELGFAALSKFRRRKGHCCPPTNHVEGKFKLGQWVITQRYLKNDLSVERKKGLDRIDFVWNWRDFAWEQGFAALLKFKRREGHCRVPIHHREGNFRLGLWISTQRRKRNKMSAKRKARLNKIGFVWKADRGGRAHKRKLGTRSLIFNDQEIIELLRTAIERVGSQDAFAKRHGIDRTHLNQILSGEKSVNTAVMQALHLRKVYAPH
jgi:hypothetical protein